MSKVRISDDVVSRHYLISEENGAALKTKGIYDMARSGQLRFLLFVIVAFQLTSEGSSNQKRTSIFLNEILW